MMTFSFRPRRSSTRPLTAASVRTFVVSWKDEAEMKTDRSRRWSLVFLSTAVSIDALAVGVVFGVREVSPWWPCLLIGITTGIMSLIGLYLGRRAKARFGKPAEILAGIVLIALAVKFLAGM